MVTTCSLFDQSTITDRGKKHRMKVGWKMIDIVVGSLLKNTISICNEML